MDHLNLKFQTLDLNNYLNETVSYGYFYNYFTLYLEVSIIVERYLGVLTILQINKAYLGDDNNLLYSTKASSCHLNLKVFS